MMKLNFKSILAAGIILAMSASIVGCGAKGNDSGTAAAKFDPTKSITVVSREDGSGTRGAFIELFEIQEKDANGNKTDKTTKDAIIADKTDVMLSQIAGNNTAIGYVSVGSLSDKVKALKVDGAEATNDNIKSGDYKVSRPFFVATKETQTPQTKDFISFMLSKEGQEVVAKSYLPVQENAADYVSTNPEGKIVVAGSSSVTPIMEKLKEAYVKINPKVTVEIQQTDSTAGMTAAKDGICDIGMASRELKDSEKESLTRTQIAIDGIAVIVNNDNTTADISSESVKNIFTGTTKTWSDVK